MKANNARRYVGGMNANIGRVANGRDAAKRLRILCTAVVHGKPRQGERLRPAGQQTVQMLTEYDVKEFKKLRSRRWRRLGICRSASTF